jgi:hypothetical protein
VHSGAFGAQFDVGLTSLLQLFAAGEGGFLYHPLRDLTAIFTTAGGPTNVAADSDPVGQLNDQTRNGKNATQPTAGLRPLWRANNGKPYLAFDSTVILFTTFMAGAVSGGTIAAAVKITSGAACQIIGAVDAASANRVGLAVDATGRVALGLGTVAAAVQAGGPSIFNADAVALATWDGTNVYVYSDGALVYSGAQGGVATSTNGLYVGGQNSNGTAGARWSGNMYAAMARGRFTPPPEVAFITQAMKNTYR